MLIEKLLQRVIEFLNISKFPGIFSIKDKNIFPLVFSFSQSWHCGVFWLTFKHGWIFPLRKIFIQGFLALCNCLIFLNNVLWFFHFVLFCWRFFDVFNVAEELKNSWHIHSAVSMCVVFFPRSHDSLKASVEEVHNCLCEFPSVEMSFETSQLSTSVVNESTCCFHWVGLLYKHSASIIYEKGKQLFSAKIINPFVIKMKTYKSSFFIATTNKIGYWEEEKQNEQLELGQIKASQSWLCSLSGEYMLKCCFNQDACTKRTLNALSFPLVDSVQKETHTSSAHS